MEERYEPQSLEKKWQKSWEEGGIYTVSDSVSGQENYYQLVEFSYPSGNLHVGHWYAFAVPDIHARFQRMRGKNVLYPMGFDAFGLPAENAAIKNNKNPREWTYQNIDYMRSQLKSMGAMFDWSREVITSDPEYYKWTQWLFIQLFKAGLVEQRETLANWCPQDKTVLANEQVVNGHCDRCGAAIEKRVMKQWQVKITKYADRLLSDLDTLNWPEEIKTSQKNWIGKSEGAEISFPLKFAKSDHAKPNYVLLHGFTGRADKNFIPWLKKELEQQGFEVQAPQMPNTDAPKEEEQVGYVLQNCNINESTIIVGHSLGGVVAMKVLEKLARRIAGLVLVAPAVNPNFHKGKPRSFWDTFNWQHDYKKIQKLTNFRIILSDTLEKEKRGSYLEYLASKIAAPLKESTAKREHFTAAEEPYILSNLIPHISVFTTRPDTLFGATYLVLAPEHPWVTLALRDDHDVLENKEEVRKYVQTAVKKTEIERTSTAKEKTGVELKGVRAINPGNGKEIPLYVADYVLAGYGTGAIMAVPAHDERDFAFAKKYQLLIQPVIKSTYIGGCTRDWMKKNEITEEEGVLELLNTKLQNAETFYSGQGTLINSGAFDAITTDEAKQKITEAVGGTLTNTYRLRDWGVSRQRYWGCPIPLIHCEKCGWQAVPDEQLPVILPEVSEYLPNDEGQSPLSKNPDFVNTTCPACQGAATRETDTLDTFVDSSWYFLRYCDPKNEQFFAEKEKLKAWMPIDLYSGGAEHTTLHLLYSRFFHKALFELGLVNESEPYTKRLNRGIILGPDNNKMSKSKGNVIDPDAIVAELGADTMRMYLAFIGPYNETGSYPWNPEGVIGVHRFLERVWKLRKKVSTEKNKEEEPIASLLHKTLQSVEESIASFKMNTGVAALMSCSNELKTFERLSPEHIRFYAQMLAPYAPHVAEELWSQFSGEGSVHTTPWPQYDATRAVQESLTMAVQVNGKKRGVITVTADMTEAEIERMAFADEKVQAAIKGQEIKKVIIVPQKVVSIVAG